MNGRQLRPPVIDGDLHQDVVWSGFEVLHEDIPVAVTLENAGIDQFVLVILEAAFCVLLNQQRVWIFTLRILVKHLEVRMRRHGIEVVIVLFYILAMVALCVA